MPRARSRRTVLTTVLACAAACAGALAWILLPADPAPAARPPAPVSTLDSAPRACLIPDRAAQSAVIAAAWNGVQNAARSAKNLLAQQFPAASASSAAAAIHTAVQMRCTIVVAVGGKTAQAAAAQARQSPVVRFIVIGAPPAPAPANTRALTAAETSAPSVQAAVLQDLA